MANGNDQGGAASLLAASLPFGPWGRFVVLGANLLAWAEGFDLGATVSLVTGAVLAASTVGIAVWERVYRTRREHRRQDQEDRLAFERAVEETRRESLTAEIQTLKGTVQALKDEVVEGRRRAEAEAAERAADDERHRTEAGRLHRTIELLGEQVEQQAGQITDQAEALRKFRCPQDRHNCPLHGEADDAGSGSEG